MRWMRISKLEAEMHRYTQICLVRNVVCLWTSSWSRKVRLLLRIKLATYRGLWSSEGQTKGSRAVMEGPGI